MTPRPDRKRPWTRGWMGATAGGLLVLLAGCGSGPRPDLDPVSADLARLQAEAGAMAADSTSLALLDVSRKLETEATAARDAKQADVAYRGLTEARAAAEAAILAAVVARREAEADSSRRTAADLRRQWQDAVRMLEQTEKVAGRTARGIQRTEPVPLPERPLPSQPAPGVVRGPDELGRLAAAWKVEARRLDVPVADLDGRLLTHLTATTAPKVEPPVQNHHLRMAGWAVIAMAYRVRAEAIRREAAQAMARAVNLAEFRDQALWAMVDLERSMKDSARQELDEERQRLADREKALYESLQQFEGKFATIRQEARGTIMSLSDILFDFGKADLRREAELNLAKVAVILGQYPEMAIQVEGHTDNIGSEEYNLKLSEQRAEAVFRFLVEQGISEARMTTKGFGMSQPVASNETPEGRQKNRRVDLVIHEE